MKIYYFAAIIANVISIILFYKSINITYLSLVPLFLIFLMLFQATYFRKEKYENGFRTTYGSNLTAEEENKMFELSSKVIFALIPFMVPFIIFFSSVNKFISVFIYVISLIIGPILYKIKNK